MNAVIFPYLERDIGITAGDLGLLTSAFFLFFAGCQPVLGVMLDRYGPRRVQVVLLAVAAAGLGAVRPQPLARRADRGARADRARLRRRPDGRHQGDHAAGIRRERWGLITGFHMMAGGAGLDGGDPARRMVAVGAMSWQGLFFWLAGFCLATSAILFVVVPERAAQRPRQRHAGRAVPHHRRRADRRLLTGASSRCSPIQQLAFIGCITLWIGPWLRDVGGIADKAARADIQLYTAAVMTAGLCHERRRSPTASAAIGVSELRLGRHHEHRCSPLVCGWLAFLPSFHPGRCRGSLFGFLGACPIQYMPLMVRVVSRPLCRPGQHQQQPRGLRRDLRRPVGDREDRRPVAAHGDRLCARRLHLGVRRAVHPAACGSGVAGCCRGRGRWRGRIWSRQIERRHEVAHFLARRDVAQGRATVLAACRA